MPWFAYKAVTPAGEVIEGELEAVDQSAVIERLRGQGNIPIRAEERRRGGGGARRVVMRRGARVASRDVAMLTREMAILLRAGLPLDRVLSTLSGLSRPGPVRDLVDRVAEKVRGGASFGDALEAEGDVFPGFYIGMIKAGEAGGSLETVLERLAETLERAQSLRESVRSALQYPALVVGLAVVSLIVLMTKVVPEFRPLFDEAGAALPISTQIIIAISDFMQDFWWVLLAVLVLAFFAIRRHNATLEGRLRWDAFLLRLPLLGELLLKIEVARMTRTFGTLLTNQVNVLNALSMTIGTLGNRAVSTSLLDLRNRLAKGEGLAQPLAETGIFPIMAVQLIQVGEESGQLEAMLLRVADIYDDEVKRTMSRLLALLVPVVTIVLGVVIALIIGSILAAILSSYDLPF
ncbi:MAG: type II secretion system F family protein [Kiloniellales bacterium]|nr:type II secretion system F family protein [Kiloniellales bacterium]